MPGTTRGEVFDPHEVGVYHCWNRCVRRARLCGLDESKNKDYTYRRKWVKKRLKLLCKFFAIEVGFYAVMSNHWHLILRNRPDVVATWSNEEVVKRCLIINQLAKRLDGTYKTPSQAEVQIALSDAQRVEEYRVRLSHISHFIGSLCEYLSRHINKEDELTGTLWEGRFSCRCIEDEAGLLATGIYVDLNQIRAMEATTPEGSMHTSIGDRVASWLQPAEDSSCELGSDLAPTATASPDDWLAELTLDEGLDSDVRKGTTSLTGNRLTDRGLLNCSLLEYLNLLEETGRQIVAGKRGAISEDIAPLLIRLRINPNFWIEAIRNFDKLFGKSIGNKNRLIERAQRNQRRWLRGSQHCCRLFL